MRRLYCDSSLGYKLIFGWYNRLNMFPLCRGYRLLVRESTIFPIFQGVIGCEILFHFNTHHREWLELKVASPSLSPCIISNKSGWIIGSKYLRQDRIPVWTTTLCAVESKGRVVKVSLTHIIVDTASICDAVR